MRSIWTTALTILSLASLATPVVAGPPTSVSLPAKVVVHDAAARELVEHSVALSPTLRRQIAAIAGAPVKVEVRVTLATLPAYRRAETTIERYEEGFIRAQMQIPPGTNFVELLAHELEHVIEQIEGVNLTALLRTGGATLDANGIFETIRARDAGRSAAIEAEQALRAANAPQ